MPNFPCDFPRTGKDEHEGLIVHLYIIVVIFFCFSEGMFSLDPDAISHRWYEQLLGICREDVIFSSNRDLISLTNEDTILDTGRDFVIGAKQVYFLKNLPVDQTLITDTPIGGDPRTWSNPSGAPNKGLNPLTYAVI